MSTQGVNIFIMQKGHLDSFINNLIDQRGYRDAPHAIKDQLHKDLKGRLDQFILTRMIAAFSSDEVDTYEKLLDEGSSQEALKQFAKEHIPDYQTFMTSTLLLFQDAYYS
jgi:hypothetical protein